MASLSQHGRAAVRDLGLLQAVLRYPWLVVVLTLMAALLGWGGSSLQRPSYEAESQLLLTDPRNVSVFEDDGGAGGDPGRYVRNQARRVTSSSALQRTAEQVGEGATLSDLGERITAQPSLDLDLITIRASDPSAEGAAALANAAAASYQQLVREEVQENAERSIAELDVSRTDLGARIAAAEQTLAQNPADAAAAAERDAAAAQLVVIRGRADQIAVDAALYGSGVEEFEPATVPREPSRPRPLRDTVAAGLVGLLGAAALAWWLADRTHSADRREDAAAVLGAPLLGEVPDFRISGIVGSDPTRTAPTSPAAEAYQFAVASLEFALTTSGARTLAITSAQPGDGKSVTAFNLAVAAMRDGRRVLLVDADKRLAGLTRLCEAAPEPGLNDLTNEQIPFEGCVAQVAVPGAGPVPLVPVGSEVPDTAGFFRTPEFRKVMVRMRDQADLVLVDCPPLLAVADTSAIAGQAEAIVLVVGRGTPLRLLADVRERLDFIGTPLVGYVFNRAAPVGGRFRSYGYSYGYGYARGDGKGGSHSVYAEDAVQPGKRSRRGQPVPMDDQELDSVRR